MPNITRSESNQTMKFCQLIEYKMRNILLEKSCTKCGGETITRPFSENQNWAYLWISSLNFYTVYFYCISSWGLSKYIETKWQTTCFYLILTFFKKTKRGVELVSLLHFLHHFWRKIFLLLYSNNWPNFIFWLSLLREILYNMCNIVVG